MKYIIPAQLSSVCSEMYTQFLYVYIFCLIIIYVQIISFCGPPTTPLFAVSSKSSFVVFPNDAFTFFRSNDGKLGGSFIDILSLMGSLMNFSYTTIRSTDGLYGSKVKRMGMILPTKGVGRWPGSPPLSVRGW